MSNRKKKAATTADIQDAAVEELLRAAEEDVFLKLNLNSHTLRGSSSQFIDPDLDRRFQSLKLTKTPKINQKPENQSKKLPVNTSDDLLGRFEALKKSLPENNNNNVESLVEEEEDEVEKVIKWAMDAARLDPSPDSAEEESEEDYDSEEDYVKKGKKGNITKKKLYVLG